MTLFFVRATDRGSVGKVVSSSVYRCYYYHHSRKKPPCTLIYVIWLALLLLTFCVVAIHADTDRYVHLAPSTPSSEEDAETDNVGGWDGRDGRYIWSERLEWQVSK